MPAQSTRRWTGILVVQGLLALAVGITLARGAVLPGASLVEVSPPPTRGTLVEIERQRPLRIEPLYDEPSMVSDAELGAVLAQVVPRFGDKQIKPNFVEHALRIWSIDATFNEAGAMSGAEMKDFLTNHGKYLASWGDKVSPLVNEEEGGVSIRWGKEECASVHHDHWLACLTEAGVSRDEPVFTPNRHTHTINDVIQQALRDVKVDESEVEWSPLAFALWMAPQNSWKNSAGRHVSFDLLAQRLMRGTGWGVCSETHRVYSMMALIRLDDDYKIFSPAVRESALAYLRHVRDLILESQFEDGHWPPNWYDGKSAVSKPLGDPSYRDIIATGHHLEWQSIAPPELLIPIENRRRAAQWCIKSITSKTHAGVMDYYTFYSHVGGALANWRKVRPADLYREWEPLHPVEPQPAVKK